ncbi:MAG: OmpA family protein [Desulfobulbaceae bacterium]|nr:OmpA family protein [Desulfobulbaceae bacterium]
MFIQLKCHITLFLCCCLFTLPAHGACPQGEATVARGEQLFNASDTPDYPAIEALFRRAISQCPTWSQPARYLGDILAEQNRFQEAITAYEQALGRDSNDFEAMLYLGDAYQAVGKKVHALRYFTKGIRMIENDNRLLEDNRELLAQYQPLRKELSAIVVYVDANEALNHLDRTRSSRLSVRPSVTTAIEFLVNRADLEPDWQAQLDTIAEVLNDESMRNYRQIIQGHADIDGNSTDNDRLSLNRARSVQSYLIARGVSSNNIFLAEGIGERRQLERQAGESDQQWKRRNRRVVFISCEASMDRESCLRSAGVE